MEEKKFSKLIVKIHTKAFDADSIMKTAQPVIDFANQHDIALRLERDAAGQVLATSMAEGYTSAYCKGAVQEIKEMLKRAFSCKVEVLLYAY